MCPALVAEVVKHYFPNFVDLHNYPSAQALSNKTTNWNILNRLFTYFADKLPYVLRNTI